MHIDRYLKNNFPESIVHMIKHSNFQLYRAYPEEVIWKKLAIDSKDISKRVQPLIHRTVCL